MSFKKHLLLVILTMLVLSLFSQTPGDHNPVFAINITLIHDHKRLGDYVIYVKYEGETEDTVKVRKGNEVYVTLKRNEVYTFTFHKEGFLDREMIVNTELPEKADPDEWFSLNFHFDVTPLNVMSGKPLESLPAAYAIYDSKQDDFFLKDENK